MLPTTIDEVIARLEAIVEDSIARADRLGYFAALYLRVTLAVRDGIAEGRFDDGERMERLDVAFAGRYLAAYDLYRAGELPSRAWLRAFEAAADPHPIVLQHLLAGMNAHINLDLGVAAARVCPGAELAPLRGDFDRINDVLASLTPLVEQEVDGLSPDVAALSGLAPKLELRMVGFAMDDARTAAWRFAQELAPLDPRGQVPRMARRDGEVALLADAVLHDGLVVRAIRARESGDVARNVEALARGELRATVPPLPPAPPAGARSPSHPTPEDTR
ncbi:MAG TPA: DUF5995 family protein [Longimicrobiaceae bacterium]|nr:DUF5995 family protein [Longimicrobiaceae bacterium]